MCWGSSSVAFSHFCTCTTKFCRQSPFYLFRSSCVIVSLLQKRSSVARLHMESVGWDQTLVRSISTKINDVESPFFAVLGNILTFVISLSCIQFLAMSCYQNGLTSAYFSFHFRRISVVHLFIGCRFDRRKDVGYRCRSWDFIRSSNKALCVLLPERSIGDAG